VALAVLGACATAQSPPPSPVRLPTPAAGIITFYLGLPTSTAALRQAAAAASTPGSSGYRRFTALADAAARFGASGQQIDEVVRSVGGLGLQVTVDPTRLFARVSGSAEQWRSALGAPLSRKPATSAEPFDAYELPNEVPDALVPNGTTVLLPVALVYDPSREGGRGPRAPHGGGSTGRPRRGPRTPAHPSRPTAAPPCWRSDRSTPRPRWGPPTNARTGETVWNDTPYGQAAAGGGGVSKGVAEPDYQTGVQTAGRRAIPDVSAQAAIVPGWPVVIDGVLQPVGGTSGATPLVAAATALVSASERQAGRPPVGFANPWLYAAAARATFFDVVEGGNDLEGVGCCSAGPGYDPASGLGVPNWAALPATLPPPGS
jgi:pro-kumamolisin-like protein